MIVRSISAVVSITLLTACTQGQKGRNTEIKTSMDSVSYAIGADIGGNLKRGKVDSLNVDLLAAGLADGLDSTLRLDQETLQGVMNSFMMKMQTRMKAEEAAKGRRPAWPVNSSWPRTASVPVWSPLPADCSTK